MFYGRKLTENIKRKIIFVATDDDKRDISMFCIELENISWPIYWCFELITEEKCHGIEKNGSW